MNPRGPLPTRVYWVRRVVVLVALLVVLSLIFWLGSAVLGGSDENSAGPTATQAPGGTTAPPTSATGPSPTGGPPQDTRPTRTSTSGPPSTRPTKSRTTTPTQSGETSSTAQVPPPTAACDPTQVDMAIEVDDASVDDSVPVTFALTPLTGPDCVLSVTPEALEVQVTTGDTTVWSSTDCPNALPASKVEVRSEPAGEYRFTWGGRMSDDGCDLSANDVGTGGYFVRAAFIGGEPHEAYFDMQ